MPLLNLGCIPEQDEIRLMEMANKIKGFLIMGYSRKNPNWKTHGFFRFFTLPLEIPGELLLHPRKSHKIVLHPLEIQSLKIKTVEIPDDIFLITPANSTSFLIEPWNFHILLFQYPWKFYVFNPSCLDFIWNSLISFNHAITGLFDCSSKTYIFLVAVHIYLLFL